MSSLPMVYLARHGETEWSKSGQHTGRTDVALTAKGEADAKKIGSRLRVWSSPTPCRARCSARRTAELAGFAPDIEPGLLEWNYGEYEGLKTAEIRAAGPAGTSSRTAAPAASRCRRSPIESTNWLSGSRV